MGGPGAKNIQGQGIHIREKIATKSTEEKNYRLRTPVCIALGMLLAAGMDPGIDTCSIAVFVAGNTILFKTQVSIHQKKAQYSNGI